MEDNKKIDRLSIIKNIIVVFFIVILLKALYMTTFKYEHYNELAANKTYKQLPIKAPRGEIRDKYGKLLAGNQNLFTIQVSADSINKKDENGKSMANDICLDLINLLEKNNEEYIDEFPIYLKNGNYYYTFDDEIKEFKSSYGETGIPQNLNAEETFYYIVDKEIMNGTLSEEDRKLKPTELQAKLNQKGIYPPILVSTMMFTEEKNKQDWLASYGIDNPNISAKNAFKEIRNSKSYDVDKNLSDEDARKILIVRDLIKSQGYSRYNPVTIAKDISQKTMAQIEEKGIRFPGVSVANEPVRYYPEGNLASHTIGHMGKIPSSQENYYLKEKEGKQYLKGDTIGMSGIEKEYEEKLKGIDGYRKVQVDALGKVTKDLEVSKPISGDTVYLSIDMELQKKSEESLEKLIKAIRTGGTYQSEFGNKTISTAARNAKSGAVIAIDVKTGDVLSLASYPDFDPNKFVNGISVEDYDELQPDNPNDLLDTGKQMNLVTQGAFQPGSVYKPLVGMAAIDNGLSPNFAINDPGVYYLSKGGRPFADLIWHKSRSTHGYTDLYKAIQESCNIYFYTLATGRNWAGGNSPDVKIGVEDVLEYGKKFGLDEATGLDKEIGETKSKYPSVENKLESAKSLLRNFLDKEMKNAFKDISKAKDKEEYEARIEEIVNWADEPKKIDRVEAMERLEKLNVKEEKIEPIADDIVFDHLNFAKWSTADTFNISIGQGENQYTPAQMARFTAAIANGGNLVELSVVDRIISSDYSSLYIDENEREKIDFNDSENLKHIAKGMELVTTQGTAKSVFGNFPIDVAAKTGTAEKSGKIPTKDEFEYLKSNIGSYGVSLDEALKLSDELKKEREKELSQERKEEIQEELKSKDIDEERKQELEKELKEGVDVKLENTNKVNAIYLRKAIKELNPKINDEQIDRFKQSYDTFSWSLGFAPANDPEIAVVVMIPQGGSGSNSTLLMRDVMGYYFGLNGNDSSDNEKDEKNELNEESLDDSEINFVP